MIESVLSILSDVTKRSDLQFETELIESHILDSFELVLVLTELEREFNIHIDGSLITPENFASARALTSLIERIRVGA